MPLMQLSPSKSDVNRTATKLLSLKPAPSGLTAVMTYLACRMSRVIRLIA